MSVNNKHETSRSFTVIRSDDRCNTGVDPLQGIRVIRSGRVLVVCVLGDALGFSLLREELLHSVHHLVPNRPRPVAADDDHVGFLANQIGAMSDRCLFGGGDVRIRSRGDMTERNKMSPPG